MKLLQLRAVKFLKCLLIAALFCGGAAHSARADEASKRAKIDQVLDEMHADPIIAQMIGQVNNLVSAQDKTATPSRQCAASDGRAAEARHRPAGAGTDMDKLS